MATVAQQSTAVVVATSARDAAAVEAVKQHHAELAGALTVRVDALLAAAERGEGTQQARQHLLAFLTDELVPHATAEEEALYPAAAATERARLLVDGMLAEHTAILELAELVRDATGPVRSAAAGYAIQALFAAHLAKENDLVLPVVAADPSVSLADVLDGMHELLGHGAADSGTDPDGAEHRQAGQQATSATHGHGGCGCGGHDEGVPELDVRAVPHAIRHATVLGAFDAVPRGGALDLVAPHDPQPLLRQLAQRADGRLDVAYLQRGPESWRLRLTRS